MTTFKSIAILASVIFISAEPAWLLHDQAHALQNGPILYDEATDDPDSEFADGVNFGIPPADFVGIVGIGENVITGSMSGECVFDGGGISIECQNSLLDDIQDSFLFEVPEWLEVISIVATTSSVQSPNGLNRSFIATASNSNRVGASLGLPVEVNTGNILNTTLSQGVYDMTVLVGDTPTEEGPYYFDYELIITAQIPEPTTLALASLGLMGVSCLRRKRS